MESRIRLILTVVILAFLLLLVGTGLSRGDPSEEAPACSELGEMPALPTADAARWIGEAPPARADLDDRVVLLTVWTFG